MTNQLGYPHARMEETEAFFRQWAPELVGGTAKTEHGLGRLNSLTYNPATRKVAAVLTLRGENGEVPSRLMVSGNIHDGSPRPIVYNGNVFVPGVNLFVDLPPQVAAEPLVNRFRAIVGWLQKASRRLTT